MSLDLLVPDLLLPPDAPAELRALRLPALERWLARADVERGAARTATECLAAAYGLVAPVAVGAISMAGELPPPKGEGALFSLPLAGRGSLRADPVHMRVERDSLTLHDASVLDVTREEAEALVATLNAHFAPDIRIHAAAPDRWYASVAADELPVTTALATARGRNVFGMLPTGKGCINWRAAITEAQMVLSGHAVNAAREAVGALPVNSVWFWGEGVAPAGLARPYSDVHACDAFAAGLAALSGARLHAVPRAPAGIDLVGTGDTALVILDDLTAPLHRVDVDAWRAKAGALDDAWFRDLGDLIARFDRVRIVLPSEKGSLVATLTPAARRRWFRRRKPLATHA
jgi:hypothetical protein